MTASLYQNESSGIGCNSKSAGEMDVAGRGLHVGGFRQVGAALLQEVAEHLPRFRAERLLLNEIFQLDDGGHFLVPFVKVGDVALLRRPRAGARGFAEKIDAVGVILKILDGGEILQVFRVQQRETGDGFQLRAGARKIAEPDVCRGHAQMRERLVSGAAQGLFKIGQRGLVVALGRFQRAEIRQHTRGGAAVPDGCLEKSAFIAPIRVAQEGAHAKETKPDGGKDASRARRAKAAREREQKERAWDIEPMLGGGIEREKIADRQIGREEREKESKDDAIRAPRPAAPKKKAGEKGEAEQGLELAEPGLPQDLFVVFRAERNKIALHVQMDGRDEKARVFGPCAGSEDGADRRRNRFFIGRRSFLRGKTQRAVKGERRAEKNEPPSPEIEDRKDGKDDAALLGKHGRQQTNSGGQPARGARKAQEIQGGEAKKRREQIGPSRDINDGGAMQREHGPQKRRRESGIRGEKPAGEEKEKHGARRVQQDVCEMIPPRLIETVEGVVEGVGDPLERPVKVGRGGVGEKKVPEARGNEQPASNKRIAQDERGVVPYKAVPQGGPVNEKHRRYDQEKPFHRSSQMKCSRRNCSARLPASSARGPFNPAIFS